MLTDSEFSKLVEQYPPDQQAILRRWREDDLRGAAEIRRKGAIAQATIDMVLAGTTDRIGRPVDQHVEDASWPKYRFPERIPHEYVWRHRGYIVAADFAHAWPNGSDYTAVLLMRRCRDHVNVIIDHDVSRDPKRSQRMIAWFRLRARAAACYDGVRRIMRRLLWWSP